MLRVFICGLIALLLGSTPTARAGDFFSFFPPWDDATPSATDASAGLEAPAGRDGFVTVEDGHLFANGKRFRIFGVNLGTNFPTHEDAEKIAGRLAKFGFNVVRLRGLDAVSAPNGLWNKDQTAFDQALLDRLDYFVSQLKTRGIYTDFVLHTPLFPDQPASQDGVDNFSPKLVARQKDFARRLLTHVNPYTKNAYAAEPAIALLEINSGSSVIALWHSGQLDRAAAPYRAELAALWTDWLRKKYGDDQKISAAWGAQPRPEYVNFSVRRDPGGGITPFTKQLISDYSDQARDDWQRFLWQTEERYWPSLHRFLREDLQARSLISGMPLGGSFLVINNQPVGGSPFLIQQHMDVITAQPMWRAPEIRRADDPPKSSTPKGLSNVRESGALTQLALQRVAGLPYVCTAYPGPARSSAEDFPLLCAYAALQDWDGVFANTYSPLKDDRAREISNVSNIDLHPATMATLPAALALFGRGDVAPAKTAAVASVLHDIGVATAREQGPQLSADKFGVKPMEVFLHRVGVRQGKEGESFTANPAPIGPKFTSETGELTWNTEDQIVSINTPRSQGVIGFIAQHPSALNDVKIDCAATRTGFGLILLTVLDGIDFKTATRILVTATDQEWTGDAEPRTRWGNPEVLVEGLAAKITLPPGHAFKAWALDERGQRRNEIPIKDGILEISPTHRTLWYELAR